MSRTRKKEERAKRTNGEEREIADRVVISYPEDLSDWGRFQIEKPSFVSYLKKMRGEYVEEGESWEEFVGVGCCGNTLDVPLVVESVEGGNSMGEETEIEFEVREACGIEGGWNVQSGESPTQE